MPFVDVTEASCRIELQNVTAVDIGLENVAETQRIHVFDPKATLLGQWILATYSAKEFKQLLGSLELAHSSRRWF